jgi:uncharacterized protein YfaP (DUF2135 family)
MVYRFSTILARVAGIAAAALLASCGGQHNEFTTHSPKATTLPGSLSAGQGTANLLVAQDSIRHALVPEGIDPQLFEQLRAALLAGSNGRQASAPPSGDANLLDDITFEDDGAGGYNIFWTYKNRGDYDLNGEVNVADLTPVGQNYRATPADPNWPTAEAADGDKNGEVNLADVTQIGQHYRAQVGGYNVYGGPEQTGPWTLVGTIGRSSGDFGVFPAQFEYRLGIANEAWYLIVPHDFAGVDNVGTDGGGGGDGATVNIGTTTTEVTDTVGSAGGTITGPVGSPLEGISVNFPVGAVEENCTVTLGSNDGSITPVIGTFSGVIIDLDVHPAITFNEPVEITLPLEPGTLPVPYYIPEDGTLKVCSIKNIDRNAGTWSFVTWHDSKYSWLNEPPGVTGERDGNFEAAGFLPSKDGFLLDNDASNTYYPTGRCTGFTAFAQWYFKHKAKSAGQLYPRYGTSIQGMGGLTGEGAVVTRAYTSVNVYWDKWAPYVAGQGLFLSDSEIYSLIRNAIANTKQPQLLSIQDNAISGRARHSVLAYRANNGTLSIYNPGEPTKDDQRITMSGTVVTDFDPYVDGSTTYVNVYLLGDGSNWIDEPYEEIFKDAEANFQDSNKPKVTVQNFTSGDEVTERNVTLTGNVTSVEVLVDKLELQVANGGNVITVTTTVDQQGNFNVVVPLKVGENGITFITSGKTLEGRQILPNDQKAPFLLIGNFDYSVILVTMTWNLSDTDVDLYVTDPSQNTSWYGGKLTPDGGELDVDNTSGRGPEHWTLNASDTVQFGGSYRVGVHYYSDRDHGPVSGNVNVLLYEGSQAETSYDIPFSIGVDNSGNANPGGTGGDWIYLPPIIPLTGN